ncbi:MAG: lytic transglycosylase domain-containing protein [Rhodospirillales bacterium]|nr:lytic transglycosylase domain-containing protein [Rhodospirillales bacterium]
MRRHSIAGIVLFFVLTVLARPGFAGSPLLQPPVFRSSFAARHSGQPLHAPATNNFGRWAVPALAAGPALGPGPADPGQACRQAIAAAERANGVPTSLMEAIGRVESGRPNGHGGIDPWPWSINVEGTSHVYPTEARAIAAALRYEAQGIRSIDFGCMQVNLLHHPHAFASLALAFDPAANAAYAGRFLASLHAATGSWAAATADYHSQTPALGAPYAREVMAVWPAELGHAPPPGMATLPPQLAFAAAASTPTPAAGSAFSQNMWSRNMWTAPPKMPIGSGILLRGPPPAVIRLPAGSIGKTLAAYRAAPVQLARRLALAQR